MEKINISKAFSNLSDQWVPKEMLDSSIYKVKFIKGTGELGWHAHAGEDKLLIVFKGKMALKTDSGETVISEGEMASVPAGVNHCPVADPDTHFIIIEQRTV